MINPKTDTVHVLIQPDQADTIWISSKTVNAAYSTVVPELLEYQSTSLQLCIAKDKGVELAKALGFKKIKVTDITSGTCYTLDVDTGEKLYD